MKTDSAYEFHKGNKTGKQDKALEPEGQGKEGYKDCEADEYYGTPPLFFASTWTHFILLSGRISTPIIRAASRAIKRVSAYLKETWWVWLIIMAVLAGIYALGVLINWRAPFDPYPPPSPPASEIEHLRAELAAERAKPPQIVETRVYVFPWDTDAPLSTLEGTIGYLAHARYLHALWAEHLGEPYYPMSKYDTIGLTLEDAKADQWRMATEYDQMLNFLETLR